MKTYEHKPLQVQAVQVVKPYRGVTANFHRNHAVKGPHGIKYFALSDAPGQRAFPGDWVLKHPDGKVEVLTDEVFRERYEEFGGGLVDHDA